MKKREEAQGTLRMDPWDNIGQLTLDLTELNIL